ncbi:hypothetical protein ABTZ93_05050 [Streptomyces sp. NPDC097941]|uniref:hypothetical protein n=1 Tax=Streptomyces sp. NPDC097941 TaxID=3155685 RepID=UPI0033289E29
MNYSEAVDKAVQEIQETVRRRLELAFGHEDRADLVEGFIAGDIAFVIFDDCVQSVLVHSEEIVVPDSPAGLDDE